LLISKLLTIYVIISNKFEFYDRQNIAKKYVNNNTIFDKKLFLTNKIAICK